MVWEKSNRPRPLPYPPYHQQVGSSGIFPRSIPDMRTASRLIKNPPFPCSRPFPSGSLCHVSWLDSHRRYRCSDGCALFRQAVALVWSWPRVDLKLGQFCDDGMLLDPICLANGFVVGLPTMKSANTMHQSLGPVKTCFDNFIVRNPHTMTLVANFLLTFFTHGQISFAIKSKEGVLIVLQQ